MKLIAKKPCSFGGLQFYIGDEIPVELVADARQQEQMGVITIMDDTNGALGREPGTLFTLEQAEKESAEGIVINLRGWDYSETGKVGDVTATPEQIQHTFGILQCTAEDGTKYIADITDETVLLLIHAADSRKTVKNAAKEQRDKLSSSKGETNGDTGGNAVTGTHTEGS